MFLVSSYISQFRVFFFFWKQELMQLTLWEFYAYQHPELSTVLESKLTSLEQMCSCDSFKLCFCSSDSETVLNLLCPISFSITFLYCHVSFFLLTLSSFHFEGPETRLFILYCTAADDVNLKGILGCSAIRVHLVKTTLLYKIKR